MEKIMSSEVSAYYTWSCNFDQKMTLVNLLLKCPNYTNLSSGFSWASQIESANTPHTHVENIVNTCLKYPGRIELLVDRLFSYEKDSQPMLKIFSVLDKIFKLPVSWEKLSQLKTVLTDASDIPCREELLKICGKCLLIETLPKEVFQQYPERDTLIYLIDWLVRRGRLSTGKVPILEFVRRVTPYVNDFKALDTWIKDVARHFQLTPEETDQLGKDSVCSSPKSFYLLIKLDQAAPNLDTYNVEAWFAENHAEEEPPVIYSSSEAKLLAELPQVVDNILNCILYKQFAITYRELTIEFFLPKELLCHPVDQWIIDPDIEETLGSRYRLVVRSRERFENDRLLRHLKDHWQDNILQISPEACTIWLNKSEWKGVTTHLENHHLFFTLKFVPDQNFLFKLIQLGVPFVLWPRQLNHGEEIQELHKLLSCSTCPKVEQVPEVLRRERLKRLEEDDKTCITYHLSLLWDVPDRRPKLKLEAPTWSP
jgi:hypothetical protein